MSRAKMGILTLALLLITILIVAPVILVTTQINIKNEPPTEPTVVLEARFDWTPNPASVNEGVTGATQIKYQSLFYLVPIRYIVKVDGRLAKPVIVSTNLPYKEFVKSSDGWWIYDSGCFIEINPPGAVITKYLDFVTSADQPGRYQGIVTHPSLVEDPFCGADSGLSATAILIVDSLLIRDGRR